MKLSFMTAALMIFVLSTDAQENPGFRGNLNYGNSNPQYQQHLQPNYETSSNSNMKSYNGMVQYAPAAPSNPQYLDGPASFPPSQVSSFAHGQSDSRPLAQHAPSADVPHAPATGVPRTPANGGVACPRCPCAQRTPVTGVPCTSCASASHAPAVGTPRAPCHCARTPTTSVARVPVSRVPHASAASAQRVPCACVRGRCPCTAHAPASRGRHTHATSAKRAPVAPAQHTHVAIPHLGHAASLSSGAKPHGTSALPASEGPESAASGTSGNSGKKASVSTDQFSRQYKSKHLSRKMYADSPTAFVKN